MNVTALAEDDGDALERYLYDPYGNVTFLKADWSLQEVGGHDDGTASAYDNPILFAGYYRDSETALAEGTPGDSDLGKVVERYRYDPYGKVTVLNGADGIDPDTTPGGEDEEWSADPCGNRPA